MLMINSSALFQEIPVLVQIQTPTIQGQDRPDQQTEFFDLLNMMLLSGNNHSILVTLLCLVKKRRGPMQSLVSKQ